MSPSEGSIPGDSPYLYRVVRDLIRRESESNLNTYTESLPANQVRVLVTDLDNTLFYPDSEEIPSGLPARIRNWKKQGGQWVVATGRRREEQVEFYRQWGFRPDYYIARERFIYLGRKNGGTNDPFTEWNRRLRKQSDRVERETEVWKPPLREWMDENGIEAELKQYYAIMDRVEHSIQADVFLREILPEDRKPMRNQHFIGVVPKEVGKGRCLQKLAGHEDWKPQQILAVGDSGNDRDMLDGRYDFHSAAVGNAEPEIKDRVRDNDGTILPHPSGEAVIRLLEALLEPSG